MVLCGDMKGPGKVICKYYTEVSKLVGLGNRLGIKGERIAESRRATVVGKFKDDILGLRDVNLYMPGIEPIFKDTEVGR